VLRFIVIYDDCTSVNVGYQIKLASVITVIIIVVCHNQKF